MSKKKSEILTDEERKWDPETIKEWTNKAGEMRKPVIVTGKLPEESKFYQKFFEKILPGFTGLTHSLADTAGGVTKTISLSHATHTLQAAGSGFQIAGVALAGLNFIRIPAIYLGALIAGKKPPITLSRNASWAYSGVILGLALSALLVPAAAGPIGIAIGGLVLGVSVFSMGKLLYQRYKTNKALKAVKLEIDAENNNLEEIQNEIKDAHDLLQGLEDDYKNGRIDEAAYRRAAQPHCEKLEVLETNYQASVGKLQKLHDTKVLQEKKLSMMGAAAFLDKGVGIGLASLAVAGLALSLFFPPVGLGIFAASAGLGAAYIVGRITVPLVAPLFKKLGGWVAGKLGWGQKATASPSVLKDAMEETAALFDKSEKLLSVTDSEHPALDKGKDKEILDESLPAPSPAPEKMLDSTSKIELLMSGKKDVESGLRHMLENTEAAGKLDAEIGRIVRNDDPREALDFIKDLSQQAFKQHCVHQDLTCLLNTFDNMPKLIPVLQRAMKQIAGGEIQLSAQEREQLLKSGPLREILRKQGLDISGETLASAHPDVVRGMVATKTATNKVSDDEEGESEGENPANVH
ncbi:hypothetical protein [Legionella spiritensis]|uniref:hypothetical protein n=1 Tax=Legionella spiritensis TaxID=452 RepID=UPI000F704DF4|nr:hypothetical protein [Legionella spiritensis]VEG91428.1 coiled-coil protein [Legionella spiritensis]